MENSLNELLQILQHVVSTGLQDLGSVHPLLIHFPIVCLFMAPLFIFLGWIFTNQRRPFYVASLILMSIGTAFLYLAVSSGESASEMVQPFHEALETLENHEHFAEQSRLYFSVLTALFGCYVFLLPLWEKKMKPKWHILLMAVFIVSYSYSALILSTAAHYGGKLVHHHKVTSNLYE